MDTADSEDDEFYFESEHIALKNNKDYHRLVKCIAILEAQRSQAIRDIDTLKLKEKSILEECDSFIKKIKSGINLDLPSRQIIAEIPKIDWMQYSKYLPSNFQISLDAIKPEEKKAEEKINEILIEKTYEQKSESNNRILWTNEEQKRLEELLVQYPPEPVEMRRFAKIAKALGNRTTKQVCSRVQKYFIKLHKAGLPIPGRIPKTVDRKGFSHKHQRFNKFLYRPSTFFPDNEVPVHMSQFDDDVPGPSTQPSTSYFSSNIKSEYPKVTDSDDSTSSSIAQSGKLQKLKFLKKIKQDKEQGESFVVHTDYRCNYCNEESIVGTRWHCIDCTRQSIDYCSDCFIEQLESINPHPLSHQIEPIRYSNSQLTNKILTSKDESHQRNFIIANSSNMNIQPCSVTSMEIKTEPYTIYDEDYFPQSFMESNEDDKYYNYLDPNFLPS